MRKGTVAPRRIWRSVASSRVHTSTNPSSSVDGYENVGGVTQGIRGDPGTGCLAGEDGEDVGGVQEVGEDTGQFFDEDSGEESDFEGFGDSRAADDDETQRSQAICLPTVFLPSKLQEAIDSVLTGKYWSILSNFQGVLCLRYRGLQVGRGS
jgi:hypothetical protein